MSDHFQRLGLPRRFSIDLAVLEQQYLTRSRQVHPDYHAMGTTDQHQESLESTSRLNEAYLALRDPFRRAEYLLTLLGGPTAQEVKNLDQTFLLEMMELREELDTLQSTGQSAIHLEETLAERLKAVVEGLQQAFAALHQNESVRFSATELAEIRKQLNAAKTLQSLQRQLVED